MTGEYDTMDTEYFLSYLFGKQSTHQLAGSLQRRGGWNRYLARILDHLERYVATNVQPTDRIHEESLERSLARIRRGTQVKDPLLREQALVTGLCQLSLVLMGRFPNQWDRKRVNHPSHYRLNHHRAVGFTQSLAQRARLLFDATIEGRIASLERDDVRAIKDAYWKHLREAKPERFLSFFRETFPAQYVDLFA
ncbi:MAG: hypothetical protein ACRDHV_00475 [Actinomycetota bacterium]